MELQNISLKNTIYEDMERYKCSKQCCHIILEHCKKFDNLDEQYLNAIFHQIINIIERMENQDDLG